MSRIVSSRNLYIDSSAGVGQGDNFELQLNSDTIRAHDGQTLRLTLLQFNMYSNFYNVNTSNNKITVETTRPVNGVQTAFTTVIQIAPGNYETFGQIARVFAVQLNNELIAQARIATGNATLDASIQGISSVDLQPLEDAKVGELSDRLLELRLVFGAAHGLTSVRIRCMESDGESFALLGGDRIPSATTQGSSFTITVGNTDITVEGHYPMQRSTSPQVYLRCSLPSNNIETSSLSGGQLDNHTMTSNIIGVFQNDHEFVHYDSRTDEFFSNLRTKELNHLKLFITDRKNRPLGRLQGSGSRTAAGIGTNQSTLGNLYFTAVIRIDTIQATIPHMLEAPQQPMPDLKKSGVYHLPATSKTIC